MLDEPRFRHDQGRFAVRGLKELRAQVNLLEEAHDDVALGQRATCDGEALLVEPDGLQRRGEPSPGLGHLLGQASEVRPPGQFLEGHALLRAPLPKGFQVRGHAPRCGRRGQRLREVGGERRTHGGRALPVVVKTPRPLEGIHLLRAYKLPLHRREPAHLLEKHLGHPPDGLPVASRDIHQDPVHVED